MSKLVCSNCQNELKEGTKFCPKCGHPVLKEDSIKEEEKTLVQEPEKKKEQERKEEPKKENQEEQKETKKEESKEEKKKEEKKDTGHSYSSTVEVHSYADYWSADAPSHSKKKGIIILVILVAILLIGFLAYIFLANHANVSLSDVKEKIEENQGTEGNEVETPPQSSEEDSSKEEDTKTTQVLFSPYSKLHPFSEGLAWVTDGWNSPSMTYLINEDGKVIGKYTSSGGVEDFSGGYGFLGNKIIDKNGKEVTLKEKFDEYDYIGNGLLYVEVEFEDYKGTITKHGIYDLASQKYLLELDEKIEDVEDLGDGMYEITYQGNPLFTYRLFDAKAKKLVELEVDFHNHIITDFNEDYALFRNSDYYEGLILLSRKGTLTKLYETKDTVLAGKYSDGLIYIRETGTRINSEKRVGFYDLKGTKVMNFDSERFSNQPIFVNGYALVYFDTGYFTIIDKKTGKYTFEPIPYQYNHDRDNSYYLYGSTGFSPISTQGYLLVKEPNKNTISVMNAKGEIIYHFPEGLQLEDDHISSKGYVSMSHCPTESEEYDYENCYMNVKGEKLVVKEN